MARFILTNSSAETLVNSEQISVRAISEKIIPTASAADMIGYYKKDRDGCMKDDYNFPLDPLNLSAPFKKFMAYIESLNGNNFGIVNWSDYSLGIYLHLGKKQDVADLDFKVVFEPVAFLKPYPGHQVDHRYNKLLLLKSYQSIDQNGKIYNLSTKTSAEALYEIRDKVDKYPTETIFLDFQIIKEFINNADVKALKSIKFEFARNAEKGRLTFIVSCRDVANNAIKSELKKSSVLLYSDGMYLDDHDLIPYP